MCRHDVNILIDGTDKIYSAKSNLEGTILGELVFNTSMTGYQEIITDASYFGQIIIFTYPMIGNYGINQNFTESDKIQAKGIIIKENSGIKSEFGDTKFFEYLKKNNTMCVSEIDTRMLTKIVSSSGCVNCLITTDKISDVHKNMLKNYVFPQDAVKKVSTSKTTKLYGTSGKNIAVIDFGIKNSIIKELKKIGLNITIFPYNVRPEEILKSSFDYVLFSNGPGNPADAEAGIEAAKGLIGKVPLYGICLGHQILAIALGAKTYKLKFGHRGGNHPVINLESKKVFMTSQNHGYAVNSDTLPEGAIITYKNLNDNTNEGFCFPKYSINTVQFHPEAGPGPKDANVIFLKWFK